MRAEAEKTSQGTPSAVCTLKTPNKAPQDVKDKHFSTLCSASWVESRTGALTVGSGGYSVGKLFRFGPQSGSLITFPVPALRTGRAVFPHLGSPVGSCVSHTGPRSHPWTTPMGLAPVPYSIHVRSRSAARPVDALTTPSSSDDPFTFACDASGVSASFYRKLPRFQASVATPGTLPPSVTAPHLRLPFPPPALPGFSSTTSLSATLPAQPPPHGVPVRCVPHHPQGFPCCCLLPLPCVPASLPRRVQRGARVARFPLRLRPSPFLRWVGPRIARFEACSTFTRVPARMFAEPPYAAL